MNANLFSYLIVSSVYLTVFLVVYRFTVSNQTHFTWMRGYLLISLLLSVVLPIVKMPGEWSQSMLGNDFTVNPFPVNVINPYILTNPENTVTASHATLFSHPWPFVMMVFSIIYFMGVGYKSILLFRNVRKIIKCIQRNVKHKESGYWLINSDLDLPAFSFFNFIFVNKEYRGLTNDDLNRIKNHEIIHAKQWHTLDILFVELISVVFWFSPLVRYAKSKLQEIHEFIADEATAGQGTMKRDYAQLLINLATDTKAFNLMTGFSGKQISNRISMVSKKRSLHGSKLLFISLVPIAFVLLVSFSFLNESAGKVKSNTQSAISNNASSMKIRNVKWVNNTVVSSAELDKILGFKKGDEFDKNADYKLIAGDAVTYYNDKGYLFANIDVTTSPVNDAEVDFTFTVFEGARGKIGSLKMSVNGKKTVPMEEIIRLITINPGDWFSKTKIIESVRALSMSNKFLPESIRPQIIPGEINVSDNTVGVDIVFNMTEK